MPRYIDTEKLLKVPNVRNVCEYDETGEFISYKAVPVEAIENAPTIEAEPVRHGKWIYGVTMYHEWMKCSACNVSQDLTGCFSFCPNCGAMMYEKEGESNDRT